MEKIFNCKFVDLYIGPNFCDVTGLNGAEGRQVLPAELEADTQELRDQCAKRYKETRELEFSLMVGQTIFRVTALPDITGSIIYILRRSYASIRPVNALGLPPPYLANMLSKSMKGLVLIAGEMGAGKTSTAASLVAQWLMTNGGMGIALEDPIETPLNGVWGKGRCLQVQVSRKGNGYKESMPLALRSGASIMLIGEIRNAETAIEVVQAGINGHLIVATLHAGSIVQAIERMQTFASALPNANSLLAEGLSYVIWQSLKSVPVPALAEPEKETYVSRLIAQCLEIKDVAAVKAKIREGKISALQEDLSQQSNRNTWASTSQKRG